jgi:hypothetical protein
MWIKLRDIPNVEIYAAVRAGLVVVWLERNGMGEPSAGVAVAAPVTTRFLFGSLLPFDDASGRRRHPTQWLRGQHGHLFGRGQRAQVRYLSGRLRFEGATDPAPFPSVLLIFQPSVARG